MVHQLVQLGQQTPLAGLMRGHFCSFSSIIDHVRPNPQKPILMLMDNHETHVNIPVIDLAKENGVIILTFHPHTSHRMQPLDRGVFGPFKTFYNQAMNNWMITPGNAGKPVTIYELANLAGSAFRQAFTQNNIIKGFKVSGFVPFNENIFNEEDFLPSAVTDRPLPMETASAHEKTLCSNQIQTKFVSPSTSSQGQQEQPSSSIVSPDVLRPFPKAAERKTESNRGRPKGKSRILTDTPEKLALEGKKKESIAKPSSQNKMVKRKKSIKKALIFEDDSSDSETSISSGESVLNISEDSDQDDGEESGLQYDEITFEVGIFVIVNITTKKTTRFFVAKIFGIEDDVLKVQYLKKVPNTSRFLVEDVSIYDIDKKDVKAKLPNPTPAGGSSRLQNCVVFAADFGKFNVE